MVTGHQVAGVILAQQKDLEKSENVDSRARNWCLTWNNPSDGGEIFDCELPDMIDDLDGIKYIRWQNEIGEKTNTPHWQIYVEYEKRVRFGVVKKRWGNKVHIEPRRGTQEQARDYVGKPETRVEGIGNGPFEWGTFKADNRGERTDIIEAIETLEETKSIKEVAIKHGPSFVKFNRGFERLQTVRELYEKRSWRTELYVHWGVPNAGKTYEAMTYKPESTYMLSAPNSLTGAVWWQGYEGQEVVVIDEFDKNSFIPIGELLTLIDCYPKIVQNKNGSTQFLAKRIYICSNQGMHMWWDGRLLGKDAMEALYTRTTKVIQFTKAHPKSTRPERPIEEVRE